MQATIALDLSTLSRKQLESFVEFVNSFLDDSPHFSPTFDELPAARVEVAGSTKLIAAVEEVPGRKSRTRKVSPPSPASAVTPAPAAPVEDMQQEYISLVQDVTKAIAAGTLTPEGLDLALDQAGLNNISDLSEHLNLVRMVRERLAVVIR